MLYDEGTHRENNREGCFAFLCVILRISPHFFSTSKINKLNSLFNQPKLPMKKVVFAAVALLAGVLLTTTSCKKSYRCSCSFNNKIMYIQDLGVQSETKATEICSSFDSTVTGEVWNCTIY
jgi:hypothetical protein